MNLATNPLLGNVVAVAGWVFAVAGVLATRRETRLRAFGVFTAIYFIFAQAMAFSFSRPDRDMGNLQKILYVHVPTAWMALSAAGVIFLASVLYLWKREERYDLIAVSAAEAGTVLSALTLVQGMIWGKPTWGVWWAWDPRLTTMAVQLVMFVGYLSLRSFTEDEERRARWSAAVGILGFLNANIVYMSVRWWRTLHQIQSTPSTVAPEYVLGLRLNAFALLFVLITFIGMRYHTARAEREAESLLEEQALRGGTVHV
jgi:heme exporter protein C